MDVGLLLNILQLCVVFFWSRFHFQIKLLPASSLSNSVDFLEIKCESENRHRANKSMTQSLFRTPFKYGLLLAESHLFSHSDTWAAFLSLPELTWSCCSSWFCRMRLYRWRVHTLTSYSSLFGFLSADWWAEGSELQRETPAEDVSPPFQIEPTDLNFSFTQSDILFIL